jgi:hypothetical protein
LSFSRSAAFSASTAASRLLNPSICANNRAISASYSALDSADESKGGVTPDATAFTLIESICRTCHLGGLSQLHRGRLLHSRSERNRCGRLLRRNRQPPEGCGASAAA